MVLIVDDDPTVAQSLEPQMAKLNIQFHRANTLDSALYIFNQKRLDVVIVELDFGPLPGLALIQKWRQHEIYEKQLTGFIGLASSQKTPEQEALLKELGDIEITNKPINMALLPSLLSKANESKQRALQLNEIQFKLIDPLVKKGDFDKAIDNLKKKMDVLGPKGPPMLLDLYERANKMDDALRLATDMTQKEPNNITYLNIAGKTLLKMGRLKEARAFLERADQTAPGNIERINQMATMYLKLKEPEKSVEKFKELVILNPENPDAKFEMFSKLYDAGFDQQAIEFGKASTKPTEIVRHYNNKGVVLSKEGDTAKAIQEYERALKFYPKFKDNYRILYNVALAKIASKTPEAYIEALDCIKRCLDLEPEFEKGQTLKTTLEKIVSQLKNAG